MARLLLLDLDGVLVKIKSSWGYMHRYFGSSQEEVFNKYFRLYSSGRIGYQEWMKADIEHLLRSVGRPIYRRDLEDAFSKVEIYDHSFELLEIARRRGAFVAIISGGVNILASMVARRLGIRHEYSNILIFDERETLIPGGIPRVEPLKKDYVVRRILRITGLEADDAIYIGDSFWDYAAFRAVGIPILYDEKGEEDQEISRKIEKIRIARSPEELIRIVLNNL